eukprot:4774136-Amphidinium_carterae.1
MIRAYGMVRDPDAANKLYNEMAAKQDPSAAARAEVAVALSSQTRTSKQAFRVFQEAMRRRDPLRLDVIVALANTCARAGLALEAKALQRQLLASGLQMTIEVRILLITAFGRAAADAQGEGEKVRLMAAAWRVVEGSKHADAVPLPVLNALLQAYCFDRAGVAYAQNLLALYPQFGCSPDVSSYKVVLQALEHDPLEFRKLWFKMLRETSVTPTVDMLYMALRIAADVGDVHWATSVLQLMYAEGLALSEDVRASLEPMAHGPVPNELAKLLRAYESWQGLP